MRTADGLAQAHLIILPIDDPFGETDNFAGHGVCGFDQFSRWIGSRSLVGLYGVFHERRSRTPGIQHLRQGVVGESGPLYFGQTGDITRLNGGHRVCHSGCPGIECQDAGNRRRWRVLLKIVVIIGASGYLGRRETDASNRD